MIKPAQTLAGILLLALAVAGCGGDDSSSSSSSSADEESSESSSAAAPAEASQKEFCSAMTSTAVEDGKDVAKLASEMEETGTPADIPDTERKGFDSYLEALNSIDEDATKKELQEMTDLGLSKEQESQVQAFLTYAASQCAPTGPGGGQGGGDQGGGGQ